MGNVWNGFPLGKVEGGEALSMLSLLGTVESPGWTTTSVILRAGRDQAADMDEQVYREPQTHLHVQGLGSSLWMFLGDEHAGLLQGRSSLL